MQKDHRTTCYLRRQKHASKDKKYVSKRTRVQRKKRGTTLDPHHMTIQQRTRLKKQQQDAALKASKKTQGKRQAKCKAFGGVCCSVCNEEKLKKEFSKRQFQLQKPKCRDCAPKQDKVRGAHT